MVESSIDRLPPRNDSAEAAEKLRELCGRRALGDEWRTWYPQERMYTYMQTTTGSQSRIDRVYVKATFRKNIVEWDCKGPGIPTDHRMVLCKIMNKEMPYVGRGRWRMHGMLFADREFMIMVKKKGMKLQEEIEAAGPRSEHQNVQMLYKKFKDEVREDRKSVV